ncbi:glycosyltransferase [Marinagarivorans algicola]|uniref:glycosyltransferase n=1 Tax=Marinagarivorans algicola TaxID=1513270 RepID=UPI0006B9034A|nr:glycosyltransferase [Marinagarivorans algicola]
MSTAQIVQHLQPGGIESLALTLLDQLDKQKSPLDNMINDRDYHKNMIISLEGNKEHAIKVWPRLASYADQLIFMDKPDKFSISTIKNLKSQLKDHHISTIHTHHIGPFIYGGLAGSAAGIKNHIHTEHDGWHLQNAKHSGIQRCLNYFLGPTLVADAQEVAKQVLNHTGASSQVIYNGVDTKRFQPAKSLKDKQKLRSYWGLDRDCLLVGAAGRLESVKGHEYLIQAMALLNDNVHLAIAGDGRCATQLRILCDTLNIADRVHFLGQTDQAHKFYPMLDVFCLPSLNEGFPLAPLEAQACNIPAIVTRVGGATETLCPASGVAVAAADKSALATAIQQHYDQRTCLQKKHSPTHALNDNNMDNAQKLEFSPLDATIPSYTPRDYICKNFSIEAMAMAYQKLLEP